MLLAGLAGQPRILTEMTDQRVTDGTPERIAIPLTPNISTVIYMPASACKAVYDTDFTTLV